MTLNSTILCLRNLWNARRSASFLRALQIDLGEYWLAVKLPTLSAAFVSLCGLGGLAFSKASPRSAPLRADPISRLIARTTAFLRPIPTQKTVPNTGKNTQKPPENTDKHT